MPVRPPTHSPHGKDVSPVHAQGQRQTSAQRGYGYRWQQARARHLKASPLCVMCERQGRIKAADVVDHIIPHRGDQSLFWDETNWQSLCRWHHDSVKQRQEGGRSKVRSR